MRSRHALWALIAVPVLLLSACSTLGGRAVTVLEQLGGLPAPGDVVRTDHFSGGRDDIPDDIPYADLELSWLSDGRLAVTTWGSSSCPMIPDRVLEEAGEVVLVVEAAPADACTDDLGPTTSVIEVPVGWSAYAEVTGELSEEIWSLRQ
jgi:hypothetical protein